MGWSQILLLIIFFVIMPAWALYYSRNESKDLEGFVFGGRTLGPWSSALTAAAASTSAGLFVGAAGMAYLYGWGGATWQLGGMAGVFFAWFIVAPKVRQESRRIKSITTPELLAKRYGSRTFYPLTAFWIVLFSIPILIVQLRSAALSMETYLGLPYNISLMVFGFFLIAFSAYGGRSAISYLSTMQGLIMIVGVTVAFFYGLSLVGGITSLNTKLAAQNANLTSFFGDLPSATWFNLAFIYLFGLCSGPHIVPTYYGMKDSNTARKAFPIGVVVSIYWTVVAIYIGLIPRALGHVLERSDSAFAFYSTELMPPIIGMLLILCLLAAIFTTLDTLLMATGSSLIHDIVGVWKANKGNPYDEQTEVKATKLATLAVGVFALLLCFFEMPLITILNAFGNGAFVIFIGIPMVSGLFWKNSNKQAALFCSTVGPLLYIVWKYFLTGVTGMGELLGTMLVCLLVTILWGNVRPASKEEYYQNYRSAEFSDDVLEYKNN